MNPSLPEQTPPLFDWLGQRGSGVFLHPTSLPSPHGVGAFDESAGVFLEFLAAAGFTYWQTCPLGPTGFGDSPYQCFSVFAGNPLLVDLQPIVQANLLRPTDLEPLRSLTGQQVNFGALHRLKRPLLFAAHAAWRRKRKPALPYGDFAAFQSRNAGWLESYSYYSALKDHFSGHPWWEWPSALRSVAEAQVSPLRVELQAQIEAHAFIQYLFFGQWSAVRARAARLGIQIIGDAPIFAALDSADVWANPDLFQNDPRTRRPTVVAGVPPDYFSADGQLWGNPLYDWAAHAADGYRWWLDRLRTSFELCDVVRLDHFRGFDSYWAIPAGASHARKGRWEKGPGLDFFRQVRSALPGARLIAEDLGDLTPSVSALRAATGLPGMAVLQFAFGGEADNLYLPHHHRANSVVYPGTHDNDTTRGWYAAAAEKTRDHVRRYLRISGEEIGWDFVRAAYASVANLAILSLPDLMSLGSEARFNTPGTGQGNWTWRYRPAQLHELEKHSAGYLRELASLFGRRAGITKGAETPRSPG